MNGGDCGACQDSQWVRSANDYVEVNRGNPGDAPRVAALEFLLARGHCGIQNRTMIADVQEHLAQNGHRITREQFQHQVLTVLKREGALATLVHPGPQGGLFIPCNEGEMRQVASQVVQRVARELHNLEAACRNTAFHEPIVELEQLAGTLCRQIGGV